VTDLRYPIGRFEPVADIPAAQRAIWIDEIAAAPTALRAAIAGLNERQLDTPYRPGGWTVRQVVHHVPDSHLNAYVRCKLALTEDLPLIKPYDEARWAELGDTKTVDPEVSLRLLDAVHTRWVALLCALTPHDFQRTFRHPEYDHPQTLDETIGRYAWHGRHHTAHITALRQREGW
jgi:hypothetical protein